MDKWGRKAGVIFVSVVGLVGGALVCASQAVAMFLVFRFFAGAASWGALTISEHQMLRYFAESLTFYSSGVLFRARASCNTRLLCRHERRMRWYWLFLRHLYGTCLLRDRKPLAPMARTTRSGCRLQLYPACQPTFCPREPTIPPHGWPCRRS